MEIIGSKGFIGSHLSKRNVGDDVIYDLAAYGNLASHSDPERIYEANLMRVVRLLKYTNKRYIYISTSSVNLPFKTPYALSKLAAEEYIKNNYKNYAIVRPYTVIGVGEHKEHLIPTLIDSCLNGTEMPFVSEPVHDFIDVEDFIDNLLLVENGISEIGTGKGTTNQEVRELVEEATGKKANVKMVAMMRKYDNTNWVASKGVKTKKSLEQTIKEMVDEAKNT